jgi:hypothetical protein
LFPPCQRRNLFLLIAFLPLLFGRANLSSSAQTILSLKICELQGYSFSSPYTGQSVRTYGVVFADLDDTSRRGFYMQHENCDRSANTSDGVFVYLGERLDVVSAGDLVQVEGVVEEYYGRTEIVVAPPNAQVLSHNHPLPAPQELTPPFANNSARYYFETLEGMHVQLSGGRVIGPTDSDDRTWLVRLDSGVERVFPDDPLGTGEVICVDDNGLYEIAPEATVGDTITSFTGVVDYRLGIYCVELLSQPQVIAGSGPANQTLDSPPDLTIATFNLANLFDTLDDPATDDQVLTNAEYQRRLYKRALSIHQALGEPTLIAVQEVENQDVLRALIEDPDVIHADYGAIWQNGPDARGLDVALLYRTDRVSVLGYQARQGCTSLVDGLGPDGNGDPVNPQNALTCDLNSDGVLDGNRLFSRPPLVVHLRVNLPASSTQPTAEFWLIINHWKSKVEDTPLTQYTLPRRIEQARFVARLVEEIKTAYPSPNLFILGDLNDLPDSQPIAELLQLGLENLTLRAPRPFRYSYIYQGVSQTMDYAFWLPQTHLTVLEILPVHINADYPDALTSDGTTLHRSSDHDPWLLNLVSTPHRIYLPLATR